MIKKLVLGALGTIVAIVIVNRDKMVGADFENGMANLKPIVEGK
jgi:hypothetical protein